MFTLATAIWFQGRAEQFGFAAGLLLWSSQVLAFAAKNDVTSLARWFGARHYETAARPATIREMTEHRERFLADIRSRAGAA